VNKKLALLKYMAEHRGWYSAAELTQLLRFSPGSISPYLTDLQQAGFVEQRPGDQGELRYHSRVVFEETPGTDNMPM
jgi:DNA-binding IclR family transcriptional regulator